MATLDEVAEDLQLMLNEFAETIYDTWSACLNNCNPGQESIILNHVYPTISEVGETIAEDWPWGPGADEYYEAVMGCHEAMYDALSETAQQPLAELNEIQAAAQVADIFHDIF